MGNRNEMPSIALLIGDGFSPSQIDGATVATDTASPFTATWDSFSVANGAHTLGLRATDAAGTATASSPIQVSVSNHIRNVFVIVFENHDWSAIQGNASAPYINKTLIRDGLLVTNYHAPFHPSLPNFFQTLRIDIF